MSVNIPYLRKDTQTDSKLLNYSFFLFIKHSGSITVPYIKMPLAEFKPGSTRLSLLEFETWQIRPLSHHGRFINAVIFT